MPFGTEPGLGTCGFRQQESAGALQNLQRGLVSLEEWGSNPGEGLGEVLNHTYSLSPVSMPANDRQIRSRSPALYPLMMECVAKHRSERK